MLLSLNLFLGHDLNQIIPKARSAIESADASIEILGITEHTKQSLVQVANISREI